MRKVITFLLAIGLAINVAKPISAATVSEPKVMRVTCYHANSGATASGTVPRAGITCGAKREWIGGYAVVYEILSDNSIGKYIGTYAIEDTGSHERIRTGQSIDIYQTTYQDCKDYVKAHGDYLYVQIIKGDG